MMFFVCIIILSTIKMGCSTGEWDDFLEEEDKSNWEDPSEMFSSKTNFEHIDEQITKRDEKVIHTQKKYKRYLANILPDNEHLLESHSKYKELCNETQLLIQRIIKKISYKLSTFNKNENSFVNLGLIISKQNVEKIKKIASSYPDVKISDIDEVISGLIDEVIEFIDLKPSPSYLGTIGLISNYDSYLLFLTIIASLFIFWRWLKISFMYKLFSLFSIALVWSIFHDYKLQIKEQEAKRNAYFEKVGYSQDVCKMDISWSEWFTSFFTEVEDKCTTYHKMHISPQEKVNPGFVIFETLSKALSLFKIIGQNFGLFVYHFIEPFPFYLKIIAAIFLFFIVIIIFMVIFKYKFRVFPFLTFEPSYPPYNSQNATQVSAVENESSVNTLHRESTDQVNSLKNNNQTTEILFNNNTGVLKISLKKQTNLETGTSKNLLPVASTLALSNLDTKPFEAKQTDQTMQITFNEKPSYPNIEKETDAENTQDITSLENSMSKLTISPPVQVAELTSSTPIKEKYDLDLLRKESGDDSLLSQHVTYTSTPTQEKNDLKIPVQDGVGRGDSLFSQPSTSASSSPIQEKHDSELPKQAGDNDSTAPSIAEHACSPSNKDTHDPSLNEKNGDGDFSLPQHVTHDLELPKQDDDNDSTAPSFAEHTCSPSNKDTHDPSLNGKNGEGDSSLPQHVTQACSTQSERHDPALPRQGSAYDSSTPLLATDTSSPIHIT